MLLRIHRLDLVATLEHHVHDGHRISDADVSVAIGIGCHLTELYVRSLQHIVHHKDGIGDAHPSVAVHIA